MSGKLERQRRIHRFYINGILEDIEKLCIDTDPNKDLINAQLTLLDKKLELLDDIQRQIEQKINSEELQECMNEAIDFSKNVLRSRLKAESIVKTHVTNIEHNDNVCIPTGRESVIKNARLPKLELPSFSGNITEFVTFYDKFNATIHRSTLPCVTKLTYLTSLLKGEALATIAGLAVTEENYITARDILEKRYGRKERIIFCHLQKLLSLQASGQSMSSLWGLYDNLQAQIRSLQTLGVTAEGYGMILTPIVLSRIPEEIRMEWARDGEGHESDITHLLEFLFKEIKRRERSQTFQKEKEEKKTKHAPSVAQFHSKSSTNKCNICSKTNHKTENCFVLKDLDPSQIREKVIEKKLCFLCLGYGHLVPKCHSKNKCDKCGKRHHILLHDDRLKETQQSVNKTSPALYTKCPRTMRATIMQVVTLKTRSKYGDYVNLNVLFDGGSDRSFISQDAAALLGLKICRTEYISFSGFGDTRGTPRTKHNVYNLPLDGFDIDLISIKDICKDMYQDSVPEDIVDRFSVTFSQNFQEGKLIHVDILIGLDHYWSLVYDNTIRLEGLVAQKTRMGWMLSGQYTTERKTGETTKQQLLCKGNSCISDDLVRNLWDLDSIGISATEQDTNMCIQQFEDTIDYNEGRYIVGLPWNNLKTQLMDNRPIALKRLQSLTRKLNGDPQLKLAYNENIQDMEDKGMIREVSELDRGTNGPVFYLPHRPVVKMDSCTTKVRPVFDASAKGYNHVSLNDCLETGPNLLPSLIEILLRFRRRRYGLAADIKQAFLQIQIKDEDQHVLRFLWEYHGRTREMMFTRVPFGTTASPFLLNATIKHHLGSYSPDNCIHELQNNMYVDDLLTGADTKSEADHIRERSTAIMLAAGMTLTKWSQSLQDVSTSITLDQYAAKLNNDVPNGTKVLGLKWEPTNDSFSFGKPSSKEDTNPTKRLVLSYIARLFDPLGFLTPFTIKIKILFQEICTLGVGWDDPLPANIEGTFRDWLHDLQKLTNWRIPRRIVGESWDCMSNPELHVFCDSSEKAYGCCIYLKVDESKGKCVSLVMARSKVAPVKRVTLPRLELLAALLGARLLNFTRKALELPADINYIIYTDSMIALSWIKGVPTRWKPFVSNRVREIQTLTDISKWKHCSGIHNIADVLTRGVCANSLTNLKAWLDGPDFLYDDKDVLPQSDVNNDLVEDAVKSEERSNINSLLTETHGESSCLPLTRWRTLLKATRVFAWMNRFITRCKKGEYSSDHDLNTCEIKTALRGLIKQTQKYAFPKELWSLSKGQSVEKNSVLSKLAPFVDANGIIRARTRLNYSELTYEEKYPIILPKCTLAALIVQEQHMQLKHAGVTQMMSSVRNQYWVIGLRCLARKIKRSCFQCQLLDAKAAQAPMAPLIKERLKESFPFEHTGIDYAGPVYCKDNPGSKFYILLFTCAVIRAIHLELVDSMNISTFLYAFRRFVARRGLPKCVFSDNFKTFKRAAKDMTIIYGSKGPTWKFSVPRAPWWGGWWERMVKVIKSALKKSVGTRSVDRVELETTLIEIEACVNSRPLTFVGDDVLTGQALTPSHLLLGRGSYLTTGDTQDPISNKEVIGNQYRLWLSKTEAFWRRWKAEYLKQLPLPRLRRSDGTPMVGSIVLIHEDNCPRLQWPLGVIEELFKGKDGVVRTVKVRTKCGVFTRAIQRIHNLECTHEIDTYVSKGGRTLRPPSRFEG